MVEQLQVNKKDKAFKGYETWTSSLLMSIKMYTFIFAILLALQVVLIFVVSCKVVDVELFRNHLGDYVTSYFRSKFPFGNDKSTMVVVLENGTTGVYNASEVYGYLKEAFGAEWIKLRRVLPYTFFTYLLFPVIYAVFKHRATKESETRHIRGPQVVSSRKLRKAIKKGNEKTDIPIGEVSLPVSMECQHAYIIGTTGTGKTAVLSQIIDRVQQRHERGIVYDFKGDFITRFHEGSRDFILNPADHRSVRWSVFNEIETVTDIDALCHSLIPQTQGEDAYWNGAARDVFNGLLHYLWEYGKTTNQDIWNAVSASGREINRFLSMTAAGKAGLKHIEDPASKQSQGILSAMMRFTSAFRFLTTMDGDFSFKEWVRNGEGWIYIVNTPRTRDALRPILSLAVDLVALEMLNLSDDANRRIFLFVDELGTLQPLSSLIDILTLGRSKGASVWLGTQDFGRIKMVYGDDIAETIFNNCSTRVCYRVNAPVTAQFLEQAFGEREVTEVDESVSMGSDSRKDGLSLSRRKNTEKIILASEIMELPNLHCFVKMGHYSVAKTRITYKDYPKRTEPLILRKDLFLTKPAKTPHGYVDPLEALFSNKNRRL